MLTLALSADLMEQFSDALIGRLIMVFMEFSSTEPLITLATALAPDH